MECVIFIVIVIDWNLSVTLDPAGLRKICREWTEALFPRCLGSIQLYEFLASVLVVNLQQITQFGLGMVR
jgi:hypothetical protein